MAGDAAPPLLAGETMPGMTRLRFEVPDTWWRRHQMSLAPAILLAPACALFAVFVVWPICDSVWLSLHDWDGVKPPTFVGLGNYVELFQDDTFYTALLNNLWWLLAFMLAPAFGLALALFLNQTVFGIRLVKSLFFFPFVISQVVVGLVFGWFLNSDFGLLNQILSIFGIPGVNILGNENWATFGVIFAGLWPQTAYCMILYLTGLTAINPELIEAARLDGAAGWRMLRNIIIPQLRPATFIAIVVCVVGALRSFDLISIMTKGGPFDSSQVLAYYMYQSTFLSFRYGYGAAIATVLFLIMDVYIAFFLTSLLRRERR
jgi:multiple sugar transport system permease protein